jgi:excisionase family DNA binding protein
VTEEPKKRRFLTTEQAAEEGNVSSNQVRALLKTGELRAIPVGGRSYLARLSGLVRFVPGMKGEERH